MFSLIDQPLLFVDCQTTGATPASAHLLEVGWTIGRACDQAPSPVVTRLIALPEGQSVPPRIQRITGISDQDMANALPAAQVAEELQNQLSANDLHFACAHWAQFERTFLTDCFENHTAGKELSLQFICTCQIAKRLYPDLPSRAIRAVGGYFGLDLEEMKRSHGHVETTYFIWQKLAHELDQLGLKDVSQLVDWLKVPVKSPARVKSSGNRRKKTDNQIGDDTDENILTATESGTGNGTGNVTGNDAGTGAGTGAEKKTGADPGAYLLRLERLTRLELPAQPGVYRMLNAHGKILYVGKATSLKSRVNSYFTGRKGKDSKTKELISQVFDLNVTPLATPFEAALLENDLIKKHDPPYNRALKKRGRSLIYFSHDFASACAELDQWHRLGPFPRGSTIEPLVMLAQGWQSKIFDIGLFWGLLDQESTNRAVSLFLQQYWPDIVGQEEPIPVRSLLALGLSFYRRDLLDSVALNEGDLALAYFLGPQSAEAEEIEGEGEAEGADGGAKDLSAATGGDEDEDEVEVLTDEELVQMVRGLITGAARAYVMSRRLLRLLDATISFEEKKRRRRLVFEKGYLMHSEDISHSLVAEEDASMLFKPALRTAATTGIDLDTYDRMRVLLAEIRRLCSRGHWISLTEANHVIS